MGFFYGPPAFFKESRPIVYWVFGYRGPNKSALFISESFFIHHEQVLLALGRFGRISITPRRRTKILAMVANTDNAQFKKEPSAVTKLLTR